ncbi:hypothetical protein QYM36_019194 [Artemia franciscana]|uniref:Peptidase A2 domain-containing protein n=1 Tax=Artemia franciscana TaxID=6661 RepID=A0AA88KR37_ARTSF|nr:hypothetical protein QYM36_019194 [Artemia franciscana]
MLVSCHVTVEPAFSPSKPLDGCFVSYIARDKKRKLKSPDFPFLNKAKVNGLDILCFVDTGCSRLLIEYDLFHKILPAQNLIFTGSRVKSLSGEFLDVAGETEVLITIPGFRPVHWLALVIRGLSFDVMLGYDLLRHLNCYLDMATHTILPNDPSISFPDEKDFPFFSSENSARGCITLAKKTSIPPRFNGSLR